MEPATSSLVLKGAHVMDPEQGIDRVADVHLADGKVQFVGSRELTPNTKVVDVSGHYLSAGWIDIHVHAYGTLGFATGIRQYACKAADLRFRRVPSLTSGCRDRSHRSRCI